MGIKWKLIISNICDLDDTKVKYYQEKSNPKLADFSPFDLDAWWGRRLYQVKNNLLKQFNHSHIIESYQRAVTPLPSIREKEQVNTYKHIYIFCDGMKFSTFCLI